MTIEQALETALQFHGAGQLAEAEAIYRQILAAQPENPDALHLLGVIANQTGNRDVALDLIRRAIAIKPQAAEFHSNLGLVLLDMDRLTESEAASREALRLRPEFPEAANNLGAALERRRMFGDAIQWYSNAIKMRPQYPDALNNLGNVLREAGRFSESEAACRAAVALRPQWAEAHNNLGAALRKLERIDDACAAYREALRLDPRMAGAHSNLGDALTELGQCEEAVEHCRTAVQLAPDLIEAQFNFGNALRRTGHQEEAAVAFRSVLATHFEHPDGWNNLGDALVELGRMNEATAAFRRAIQLKPDMADAHNNLGLALKEQGDLDGAAVSYREAIRLNPELVPAYNNLAVVLTEQGKLDEAVAMYRAAIDLNPEHAPALNNLAIALAGRGEVDEAVKSFDASLRLMPRRAEVRSNLLYALHFHPALDAKAILSEHRKWNELHGQAYKRFIRPHANDRMPGRRLRIGYVSPDFRQHVVGWNVRPLLRKHDREQFEIFCYAAVSRPDAMTEELRGIADVWRDILSQPSETAAEMIRNDGIDILVDLSLHTARNRLLIFACKPAPVQVTYLGYCSTTGLEMIDYRFSDPYLDPPGSDVSCYSEKTILLPTSYWCYEPGLAPAVAPLPAESRGFATFGCMNNFAKVTASATDLWVEILRGVANSKLIIHCQAGNHREGLLKRFEEGGIERERIEFVGKQPWAEYLHTFDRIDIALDPMPYGGGITTCDGLWMGVPCVTLPGATAVGRGGRSILNNVGMPELVAESPADYVRLAIELAGDLQRLKEIRGGLRERVKASPLMDAQRFARDVEGAYRGMWERWCAEDL